MVEFSSLNPYQNLEVVFGDSPQDLVLNLKKIITPIKIIAIVPVGLRQCAYIMGDHRITKKGK